MSDPPDPPRLPPVESITALSDIRLFLESGVPADLMRAALRAAWAADPAIRDFIGIAESQWDFNDPAVMPGFGPLRAVDAAASLAARTVAPRASAELAAQTVAAIPAPPACREVVRAEEPVPPRSMPQPAAAPGPARHGSALPKPD
jgi:hypothetical protein